MNERLPVQSETSEDSINRDEKGEDVREVPAHVDEPLPAEFTVSPKRVHVEEQVDAIGVHLVTGSLSVGVVVSIPDGVNGGITLEVNSQQVEGVGRRSGSKGDLSLDPGVKVLVVLERRIVSIVDTKAKSVFVLVHGETLSESLFVVSGG